MAHRNAALRLPLLLLLLAALAAVARGAVVGFSLDIEPGPGTQDAVDFVNTMAVYRGLLDADGGGLRLSADAGTAWTQSYYNVSVNGTNKILYEWIADLCDETVVMSYDRNATNLLVRVGPYLAYADAQVARGLNRSVVVGVAIATPGSPQTWWQTQSSTELEALIASVDSALSGHASFARKYAVFFAATLFNATNGGADPLPPSIGERKALWYVDDEWVYSAQAQDAFFAFAVQQKVGLLYDAPHAGSRPHIGASKSDEALYQAFVRRADEQGIDVEFLSGLSDFAYDLAFIKATNGGS
jgi:hypothetical protein